MLDRVGLRLDAADRANLIIIAHNLAADPAGAAPWSRTTTITACVKHALAVAAEQIRQPPTV